MGEEPVGEEQREMRHGRPVDHREGWLIVADIFCRSRFHRGLQLVWSSPCELDRMP
jgi:hypothetical protein